ncbi:MAG: hypothetical protein M9939_08450 [Mesorhizobium sp.]|nr:hypothetical protein [Mesorhizobium sp.]MCO5161151.1 hypothetical protein [Mesorhizobium sp.]
MMRASSLALQPTWHVADRQRRLSRQWAAAATILVVFGTALSPFVLGDQRNLLVILAAALALPMIVLLRLPMATDMAWSSAAMVYLIVVELLLSGTRNVSSLGYTGMFVLSYVAFCGALSTGAVTRERLILLLRRLIQAFAVVSVAQAACAHLGLPIPNQILSKEAWSYNSLGVEPSHAARALAFTLLSYLVLSRRNRPAPGLRRLWRDEKWTLLAFAVPVVLTGSSLAVAILPLTLVMALKWRWLAAGGLILVFAWPFLATVEIDSVQRLVAFLTALPSMDIMAMVHADHSAALRVMPLIIFLQSATLRDASVWFGGGYEAISFYIRGNLVGVAGDVAAAGFVPGYVMVCGIFGTVLFCHAYLFRLLNRETAPLMLLWIPVFANSAWNSQIFWYSLVLLRAVHHFSRPPSPFPPRVAARYGR